MDWDNDGYPDVYVVNGQEPRPSVKDDESEFRLHDIYWATAKNDLV